MTNKNSIDQIKGDCLDAIFETATNLNLDTGFGRSEFRHKLRSIIDKTFNEYSNIVYELPANSSNSPKKA